jgi:hypothetical protein
MVYIDSEFKCHTVNDGTMTPVETDFFNDKCTTFVEGYRFVPAGESWEREDGVVFRGEMIAPWKNYSELSAAQREYEQEKLADAENALAILLGGAT